MRWALSCKLRPARIGPEALTVLAREQLQSCQYVTDATCARVVQRSAAEWGKAGPEDHGAVHRLFVRDHALAQAGDAGVDHRQNEPVGHLGEIIRVRLRTGGGLRRMWDFGRLLDRLAVLPLIE